MILALTFAACCIPTSGFLRTFTPLVVLPHHYDRVEPGWSVQGVVDMLPDKLLVNVTPENEERVLTGYMQGLPRPPQGESASHISLFDVPWAACVAVVHLNNCLHSYFPDHLVPVRTHIGLGSLIRLFPTLMKGEAGGMFSFTVYPTVIGVAYFLATDVSLSLGLVPYFTDTSPARSTATASHSHAAGHSSRKSYRSSTSAPSWRPSSLCSGSDDVIT